MRIVKGVAALAIVAVFAAACSNGAASPAASAAASQAPSESAAASEAPSQAAVACSFAALKTKTPGTLTIGADNPAYPPYYQPSDPERPTRGSSVTRPTASASRAARHGPSPATSASSVTRSPGSPRRSTTRSGPGEKDFDIYLSQVSFSDERAQAVDLSDGYYDVAQAVVAAKDSKLSKDTTISGLKGYQFGAQVGTTSLS